MQERHSSLRKIENLSLIGIDVRIRLGTRQSALATWQAQWVASALSSLGCTVEIVPITTTGDVSTRPLGEVGGQGLFTKEIQRALLEDRCDLAVHSLKDLPTEPVPGLLLAAVPPREEVGDALLSREGKSLMELRKGAVIGTGSIRRAAQLRALRPDLCIQDIRGNLDTRIKKLDDGNYDAIILAVAGLKRLGWDQRITEVIPSEWMLPAIGQAALGLEIRADDRSTFAMVEPLNDMASHAAVAAERSMLRELRGGCLAPVAGLATVADSRVELAGAVISQDGTERLDVRLQGSLTDPCELGKTVARLLLRKGAARLIESSRTGGAR